jgi:diguanylate cyclase (GGDEF)-like protein/PAS domain S-box-containing protein
MLLALMADGVLVYSQWYKSAESTTETLASDVNEDISLQLTAFLHAPVHINETNSHFIEHNLIDLSDQIAREKFFSGIIKNHEGAVYSVGFGTINGEYYGARRNTNNDIEIMRNDASTDGNSMYYSITEDMTAADLAVKAGPFDPRTREWYQAAAAFSKPIFSPVYKHFVMDDLTVSAAWPIYDDTNTLRGVLGTHILLSEITAYLEAAAEKSNGFAVIFEQETEELIATSMDFDVFTPQADNTFKRQNLNDLGDSDITDAYNYYLTNNESQFRLKGAKSNLYINVSEVSIDGIEWILVSAVPASQFMDDIVSSMLWSVSVSVIILIGLVLIYYYLVRKLAKPINQLLYASSAFTAGNLSQRVTFLSKNEIGMISSSFNHMASKMQALIDNLEDNVQVRTEELNEKKEELQLILNSTAEGVYGMNLDGVCTFCNISCLKQLGYDHHDELIGKNMHQLIHHTQRDGSPFTLDKCKISKAISLGQGFQSDDEIFWKADGTPIDVEYRAYPQIKNGTVVGGVVTFMDITDRKQRDAEIEFLNCHDPLTGLYNRRCYENKKTAVDTYENLPLSIIFADINGLKMTNDIFGHAAGDSLIKKAAEILEKSCRNEDVIARIGGDEFIILLPQTNAENADHIVSRIRSEFKSARLDAIKCSAAIGYDTKNDIAQSLDEVMANAENSMYKDKTLNRKSTNKDLINTILDSIHLRSQREEQHADSVAKLCVDLGKALSMPESELEKLERAGLLHDIGKVSLDKSLLLSETAYSEDMAGVHQHALVGYRLLSLFDDTIDIAEYVYNHHEHWDGNGYPRGIKGEQIPLISRIIAVTEVYDRILNKGTEDILIRKRNAVEIIRQGSGTHFDPRIVDAFVQMMQD